MAAIHEVLVLKSAQALLYDGTSSRARAQKEKRRRPKIKYCDGREPITTNKRPGCPHSTRKVWAAGRTLWPMVSAEYKEAGRVEGARSAVCEISRCTRPRTFRTGSDQTVQGGLANTDISCNSSRKPKKKHPTKPSSFFRENPPSSVARDS